MVLLEALDLPSLSPMVLAMFATWGVVTAEDFLTHDLHSLSAAAAQRSESAEVKQAIAEILSHLESLQTGWCNGLEISRREVRFLSMGCTSIDNLLEGGMQEGTITELVGASSTGKTQAAACAAYNLHAHCLVIYIDTCGAFSSQRVAHMLGGTLGSLLQVEEKRDDLTTMMKSIHRIPLFDIFSVLAFLQNLYISLSDESEHPRLRLLIVDSISSVISPVLGGTHSQGHALMISVGQILKKLSTTHKLAVLVTNHTVAGDGGQPKPALGGSWKAVPHVRLLLNQESREDVFKISIWKHPSIACNEHAAFCIGRAGLGALNDTWNVQENDERGRAPEE